MATAIPPSGTLATTRSALKNSLSISEKAEKPCLLLELLTKPVYTVYMTTENINRQIGDSPYGKLWVNAEPAGEDGGVWAMVVVLTKCCNASGKGMETRTGVGCRRCFREVDSLYGACWMLSDLKENEERFVRDLSWVFDGDVGAARQVAAELKALEQELTVSA